MKKKLLQQLLTLSATALACAAVLIGTPNPPAPGDGGKQPRIEDSKGGDEGGKGTESGAEPQDDEFPKDKKKG